MLPKKGKTQKTDAEHKNFTNEILGLKHTIDKLLEQDSKNSLDEWDIILSTKEEQNIKQFYSFMDEIGESKNIGEFRYKIKMFAEKMDTNWPGVSKYHESIIQALSVYTNDNPQKYFENMLTAWFLNNGTLNQEFKYDAETVVSDIFKNFGSKDPVTKESKEAIERLRKSILSFCQNCSNELVKSQRYVNYFYSILNEIREEYEFKDKLLCEFYQGIIQKYYHEFFSCNFNMIDGDVKYIPPILLRSCLYSEYKSGKVYSPTDLIVGKILDSEIKKSTLGHLNIKYIFKEDKKYLNGHLDKMLEEFKTDSSFKILSIIPDSVFSKIKEAANISLENYYYKLTDSGTPKSVILDRKKVYKEDNFVPVTHSAVLKKHKKRKMKNNGSGKKSKVNATEDRFSDKKFTKKELGYDSYESDYNLKHFEKIISNVPSDDMQVKNGQYETNSSKHKSSSHISSKIGNDDVLNTSAIFDKVEEYLSDEVDNGDNKKSKVNATEDRFSDKKSTKKVPGDDPDDSDHNLKHY